MTMNIYIYIGIRNFESFFSLQENIKTLPELDLLDQVILQISSNHFFIFSNKHDRK